MTAHGLVGITDAGAFLARLIRFDPAAVVRLRSSGGRTALWGRLPWGVLVTRVVAGDGPADVTVSAADLLAALGRGDPTLPSRLDARWRWPLPPAGAVAVETVRAGELARLAEAAAGALREAVVSGVGGRAVGQRALREALLDHVALVVTPSQGAPVQVPQRLVQAVSRMGFLGSGEDPAGVEQPTSRVVLAGLWIGLSAPYGVGWLQRVSTLTLTPL